MFGSKPIRHMWRVGNGLDNADLDGPYHVKQAAFKSLTM